MHSCLCFSLLEKLFLKASLTPPRHLAICQASELFLIAISTDPRYLVDQSSFFSCVFALFLDTSSTATFVDIVFLDTFLDRCLDTSRHLYLSRFTEPLYIGSVRSNFPFHSISLSIALCSLFPNLSHSLQTSSSRVFQAFTSFLPLVSFESLIFMHFHVLKPRF